MPPTKIEINLLEYLHLKNLHSSKKKSILKLPLKERQRAIANHKLQLAPFETKFRQELFRETQAKSEMVIAHYKENLQWALEYRKWVVLYHKGGQEHDGDIVDINTKQKIFGPSNFRSYPLPNLGREGHTYLYYIVNRWNSLPENVFFTQGSCSVDHRPFPIDSYLLHKPNIPLFMNVWNRGIEFVDYPGGTIKHVGKWKKEKEQGIMSPCPTSFLEWWKKYISPVLPIDHPSEKVIFEKWKWSHGAIFSVDRSNIRSHPLVFYQNLLRNLQRHVNPEEGHFLEKSWFYIFDRDSQKRMRNRIQA